MEVNKGTKSEKFSNGGVKLKKEYGECIGCFELRAKIKRTGHRCANLELDIGKKKCTIEWLKGKLGSVKLQKLKIEDEVRVLKQRNEELEKGFRNVKEEHGVFSNLMIENKVLECEKKAESEVEIWKVRCKELEIKVMELEKRLSAGMMVSAPELPEMRLQKISRVGGLLHGFSVAGEAESKANADKDLLGTPRISPPLKQHSHLLDVHSEKTSQVGGLLHGFRATGGSAALLTEAGCSSLADTPSISTPFKQYSDGEGFKGGLQCEVKSTVRKCLDFPAEESPHKNISPSTPSFSPIDISDSDDDLNTGHKHSADLHCKVWNKVRSSCTGLWVTLDEKELTLKDGYEAVVKRGINEEEITHNMVGQPYLQMPKRRNVMKGNAYAVSSDSETEDNTLLSRLKSINQLRHSSDTHLKRSSVDGSCFRDNPRRQSSGSALAEFLTDGDPKGDAKKSVK